MKKLTVALLQGCAATCFFVAIACLVYWFVSLFTITAAIVVLSIMIISMIGFFTYLFYNVGDEKNERNCK